MGNNRNLGDALYYQRPSGSEHIGLGIRLFAEDAEPEQYITVRLSNGSGFYTAGGTSISGGATFMSDQGAPALISSAWPIKVTDGVDVLGTQSTPFYVTLYSASLGSQVLPSWVTGTIHIATLPRVTGSVSLSEQAHVTTLSGSLMGLMVGGVSVSNQNPVPTVLRADIAAVTNLTASQTSQLFMAANPLRRGAVVFNDSSSSLYVKFGSAASNDSFTYFLPSRSTLELPLPVYTGQVDGVWESATGKVRITEFS